MCTYINQYFAMARTIEGFMENLDLSYDLKERYQSGYFFTHSVACFYVIDRDTMDLEPNNQVYLLWNE